MTPRTVRPRGTPWLRGMRRAATGTVVVALAACVAAPATGEARGREVAGPDGTGPRPGDLLVANLGGDDVAWYDGRTGAYRGAFVPAGSGGLSAPTGVTFGPDGHLYVASSGDHRVLRFDGRTGDFRGTVVDGGELESPFTLRFGPDGALYVSSGTGHRVLRYDPEDGRFLGVAAASERLRQPIGLAFGPGGLLYVVSSAERAVLRFEPRTGEPRGVLVSDGLRFPSDVALGPDGALWVSEASGGRVSRWDPESGEALGVALELPGEGGVPMGLAFDASGGLVVGDFARGRLYRLAPGADTPVLLAEEGLERPENIAVVPPGAGGG